MHRNNAIPPPVVRVALGVLGGHFIAVALYVRLWRMELRDLADLSISPGLILGGVAVGWSSYSHILMLRVLAWAIAGMGAGHLLTGLAGGLSVGDVLSRESLILGFLGAILGFYEKP